MITKVLFVTLIFLVAYSYLLYGVFLYILVKIKRLISKKINTQSGLSFKISHLIAAYNEEDYIKDKIENSLLLDSGNHHYKVVVVTDGSSDSTPEVVKKYPDVTLFHEPERKGKINAVERALKHIDADIVIFSDANTELNKEAVLKIVDHFNDPQVGAVAGEKRVKVEEVDEAVSAGEGIYWKYESLLKKWDSELYSVVGAAGELFAVRRSLWESTPPNAIIEDFVISMRIAQRGYRVVYEPKAYALESSSENVSEEMKRKVRIAAGGIQSVIWLKDLLNPFKYGVLTFQYVSHRVLRWVVTPFLLPVVFFINLYLALFDHIIFQWLFIGQALFYILALIGYLMEKRKIRLKLLFIPYYFTMMNLAVYKGLVRLMKNQQQVTWDKAKRKST